MEQEQNYFKIFEQQENEQINLKCFFENLEQTEEPTEQEDLNTNEFFVFCDNSVYNRNIIIKDSCKDTKNLRPFKAVGYLSKSEKALLSKIKKRN